LPRGRPDRRKAIKVAGSELIDLVILDVSLPDMDGREACKAMRNGGYKGPVIMLTGQTTDADAILGLDAGANDYVAKPFKFAVLLARIRAHLRQHEQSDNAAFRIGPYTFRPSAKLLVRDDKPQGAADRKGDGDPQIPVPRRPRGGGARGCCTKCGATAPASPPTRWKPTSTG
jgi:DNA-binding response OmpR family regulator